MADEVELSIKGKVVPDAGQQAVNEMKRQIEQSLSGGGVEVPISSGTRGGGKAPSVVNASAGAPRTNVPKGPAPPTPNPPMTTYSGYSRSAVQYMMAATEPGGQSPFPSFQNWSFDRNLAAIQREGELGKIRLSTQYQRYQAQGYTGSNDPIAMAQFAGDRSVASAVQSEANKATAAANKATQSAVSGIRDTGRAKVLNVQGFPTDPANPDSTDPVQMAQAAANRSYANAVNSAANKAQNSRWRGVRNLGRSKILSAQGFNDDDGNPIDPNDEDALLQAETDRRVANAQAAANRANQVKAGPSAFNRFKAGYGGSFVKGAGVAIGTYAASAINASTQEILTGHPDMMAQAGAGWGLAGGLVGAGIGAFFGGGFGGVIGAHVGTQVGSAVGQFINAEDQRDLIMRRDLMGTGALSANLNNLNINYLGKRTEYGLPSSGGMPRFFNPSTYQSNRFINEAKNDAPLISQMFFGSDPKGYGKYTNNDPMAMSIQELGQTYASTYSALLQGGFNPEQMTGAYTPGMKHAGDPALMARGKAAEDMGVAAIAKGTFGNTITGATVATLGVMAQIQALPRTRLTLGGDTMLYRYLSQRADIRFGTAGVDIMKKSVNPIIASMNETGGNIADILMKHGNVDTSYYEDVVPVASPVGLRKLTETQGGMIRADRAARLGSLSVRGSGVAMASAFQDQENLLADLPGGTDSVAYAQTRKNRINATLQGYSQADIMGYGLPMVHLEGQRARANVLPFSPSNIFALDLRMAKHNQNQIGVIQSRMDKLRRSGDLSEEQEMTMNQQMEGLKTSNASMIAELSEGMESRLPAMSAGRPAQFARFNSLQLASMAVKRAGVPVRSFGYTSGSQLRDSDAFAQSFGVSGRGVSSAYDKNMTGETTVQLLSRILAAIEGGNGSSGRRSSDIRGDIQAATGRSTGARPGVN